MAELELWIDRHRRVVADLRLLGGPINGISRHPPVAQERAERLLFEWLSPGQRRDYQEHGRFDVTGSHGTRFRIKQGAYYNIAVLNHNGADTGTHLCAIPLEDVPLCDQLLSQKIALETDERAVFHVANLQGSLVQIERFTGR